MIDLSKPLCILELANNHGGSFEHGLRTIQAFSYSWFREFTKRVQVAFKFQYRTLETFIHPDFKSRDDIKYVKRFKSTALTEDEFLLLKAEAEKAGFHTICTPFDEEAAKRVVKHNYEVIKVGSCSFTDWPLWDEIIKHDKPIIASTAGASLADIDKVVSMLQHRRKEFALMHCVAEYPVADKDLQLNQIDLLRNRYPGVPIGFSTHESPINIESGAMAVAKGATIFERHVGYRTDEFPLNAYSCNPVQTEHWLELIEKAFQMCGIKDERHKFTVPELQSLRDLRRGVFTQRELLKGAKLDLNNAFFAIPTVDGQLTANDFGKYTNYYLKKDIGPKDPIFVADLVIEENRDKLLKIVKNTKQLIEKSGVVVPQSTDMEISHHYGLDRFFEFGIVMLTVVNRDYCKKLIIVQPGQTHPEQYHKQKEETFHILYGEVIMTLNNTTTTCGPGTVVTVPVGVHHTFSTNTGAVIEEISSTHFKNDSFYVDPIIMTNEDRKTMIKYWVEC